MARPVTLRGLLALALTFALACEGERATPEAEDGTLGSPAAVGAAELAQAAQRAVEPAPESPDPVYSPFLVEMSEAALPFEVISFKDVGMSFPEQERALAYETLAEGLSHALRFGEGDEHAPMSSLVRHDERITDPSNHLYCEGRHIYVDLWQEREGWGYSLWSGCDENDEFAHVAVEAPRHDDRLASLAPLADDIAARLREAVRTGCFTKTC
ncbi:MAG TPA: hypothetical protein RMH85_35080 [Polyangiaceae bacterium LLY-WYZ-15_(1-7)]|nr:hypothetical protein [Sandaracinus sp.]HJK90188.1 hypothetical protein [Polyangiaceae bacterium LLY-WYZ-15_(1-7)]MBJ74053.1 hypothetical protein [Sandaracinus sp.]HJL06549.1 hypothetical protein [Polyangiaceae bacterium LLY-WYZ-15_(1-7)]HJL13763.1 hypothetical protein [Polyangiaceae bacterium LLY-WYZ-15_(1-7)]